MNHLQDHAAHSTITATPSSRLEVCRALQNRNLWFSFVPGTALLGAARHAGRLHPCIALRLNPDEIEKVTPDQLALRFGCFRTGNVVLPILMIGILHPTSGQASLLLEAEFMHGNGNENASFDLFSTELPIVVQLYGDRPECEKELLFTNQASHLLARYLPQMRKTLGDCLPQTAAAYTAARIQFLQQTDASVIWNDLLPGQMENFEKSGFVTTATPTPASQPSTTPELVDHQS